MKSVPFYISLFCFFPLLLFSQDSSKWFVKVGFSPDYACRRLSLKDKDALILSDGITTINYSKEMLESRNKEEKPVLGYTTGANVMYRMNKYFQLDAGFSYSRKGEKAVYDFSEEAIDPSVTALEKIELYSWYHFLELPVKANYFFTYEKWQLYTTLGVAPAFFLKNKVNGKAYYTDGTENTYDQPLFPSNSFNRFNIVGIAGVGINWEFVKKFTLTCQPEFRYYFLPLTKKESYTDDQNYDPSNYGIREYLYSAGVWLGLSYTF